jgi:hypothetical protein
MPLLICRRKARHSTMLRARDARFCGGPFCALARFLIGRHLLVASIASSRLLDECSYDEGDASYDEDGGEDGRECGHCFNASGVAWPK